MKIIRGNSCQHYNNRHGCALAIGNFDGGHLGHQALLQQLVAFAQSRSLPSAVMIFSPMPAEFFATDSLQLPPRLSCLREKICFFKSYAIDQLWIVPFNRAFAQMDRQQFIDEWLVKKLNVKRVLVGEDFHFGFKRAGNFSYLQQSLSTLGREVLAVPEIKVDHQRVSSTRIRQCLQHDDLQQAQRLLGRPYEMIGLVIHGNKLGTQLGFPTANIRLQRRVSPLHGIYAVMVVGEKTGRLQGAAYLGSRPVIHGKYALLEVFLLDFKQQIYGQQLRIEFWHKIRADAAFSSLDAMKQQIAIDVENTKHYFASQATE